MAAQPASGLSVTGLSLYAACPMGEKSAIKSLLPIAAPFVPCKTILTVLCGGQRQEGHGDHKLVRTVFHILPAVPAFGAGGGGGER